MASNLDNVALVAPLSIPPLNEDIEDTTASGPVEPSQALEEFTLFPKMPTEMKLSVWDIYVHSIPARIVRLDEPAGDWSFSVYNTCKESRRCLEKRYVVVKHPGNLSAAGARGPAFVNFVDLAVDTVFLANALGQHPIDRAIQYYPAALVPLKKVALSIRSVPLTEYMTRPGGNTLFWHKLMGACPNLEKLVVVQNNVPRGATPRFPRPPGMTHGSIEHWFVCGSYGVEKVAGRYAGVEIEWRQFVDDE